jgi:hypothetical protein
VFDWVVEAVVDTEVVTELDADVVTLEVTVLDTDEVAEVV